MSWYGNRLPNFVTGSTEERVREQLMKISVGIGEKLEIISIYHRGSFVVAWYFLDINKANLVPEDKEVKKVTKKKAGS